MNLNSLLAWSEAEFRDLPWRRDRSLYRTLVSEIMLQQTTVGTVKNHFERFLTEFPDLGALAAATEEELLIAWKGLGYYRRARSLKKIAEALHRDHQGMFPETADELQQIPGIGPYTSAALLSIGMNKRALAVDANLERVIARFYGLKVLKGPALQKDIQERFARNEIFKGKISDWRALNEGLMDLGRTVCQARKASCELCHLKTDCVAFREGRPLSYPGQSQAKKKIKAHALTLLRVYVMNRGKLLAYKKNTNEWLAGQYEVPTFILKSSDKTLKQYPRTPRRFEGLKLKTAITKYTVTNVIITVSERDFQDFAFKRPVTWVDCEERKSNLSTTTLKGLKLLGVFS